MSDLKPGTRVRVTYEGVVDSQLTPTRRAYQRVAVPGVPHHFHAIYPTDTVEVIAPPEPVFEDGAFYRLGQCVYQYSDVADREGFFIGAGPGQYDEQHLTPEERRMLVKLVSEAESA
jgi:hypothetical protein